MKGIVDGHHHIWRQTDLPWLLGPTQPRIFGPYDAIKRDYPIEEYLDDIDGTLTQANGQRMRLKSKKGLFDNKKNELELFEGIDIRGENGMMARLTRATVFVKEQRIISNEPIYAELINGWIRAQRVEILQKSRLMTFEGNVKVHLKKLPAQPKTAPAGKTAPAQPATPESRPQ